MESDADWLLAESIWIAAERQGVITATYFWVGSESDWRGSGTRSGSTRARRNRRPCAALHRAVARQFSIFSIFFF